MQELDKKEMMIRYSTIGFVLGAALTITNYSLLFLALETPFSFRVFAQMHGNLNILFLLDLIPVPASLFGAWIANWRFNQLHELSGRIRIRSKTGECSSGNAFRPQRFTWPNLRVG